MSGDSPFPARAPRVVIDTNILVAAAYKPGSASARVVSACLEGRLVAVVSSAIVREYRHILEKAVRGPARAETLDRLIASAVWVEPTETPAVVAADPSDDMLFAAAVVATARAIVSNDRPVLQLKIYKNIHVIRPPACLEVLLGEVSEGSEDRGRPVIMD